MNILKGAEKIKSAGVERRAKHMQVGADLKLYQVTGAGNRSERMKNFNNARL